MYPFLLPDIFGYNIPLYNLMIAVGIFFMLLYVGNRFEKVDGFTRQEANTLLIYIAISLAGALGFSWLSDGVFHSLHEGEAAFGSITFLGGLIGGLVAFVLLISFGNKKFKPKLLPILNTLIVGVVLAHAFGRIGCTFAGCCYGIPTESFLGMSFPYGESGGIPVYPTQLFEAVFLFIFFFVLDRAKSFKGIEFEAYLIGYGAWRFLIEFIRGDDRGEFLTIIRGTYSNFPTPAQYISVIMFVIAAVMLMKKKKSNKELKNE